MIQKHYFIKSILFKRIFLLASFLCLAGATAWSQDTLTVSGTQIPPFKVYDGSILAAATPGSLMGVAADDTVFIAETYAYYGSAVVGMNKPVIISYILGGPQAEEYVVKNDTLAANIVVRPLGITGIQITPKVYDHNIGANLDSLGHLTNVVEGDSGLVFVNISCSYVTGNAGTFSPVAMQYSIYGPASFNYAAPASDTLFGMVLPRTIYASGVQAESTKVYDGTSAFVVTNHGVIDPNNVLAGDTVYHTAFVNAPTSNQTNGFSTQLNISFHTYGPQGGNYVILDTVDVLWGSISKLALYITDPSIRTIKEYDGTNIAEVVTPAIPLNLVEGDSITITTTATYDDAEVGFEKPITIHHVLSGPQALNYRAPADAVVTGSIIMPTVFDTTSGNAFHAVVNGYCEGDSVKLAYHLISGYPVAYSLVFSDEAIAQGFQNSTWTPCTPTDSIVSFPVPANCAGGSYQVAITFTNLASVNSTTYTVPFTINLTNKYLIQVFDDVLSIDNSLTGTAFWAALQLDASAAYNRYARGEMFWSMNSKTYAKLKAKAIATDINGAFVAMVGGTLPIVSGDIDILEFMPDNDIVGGFGDLYLLGLRSLHAEHHAAVAEHARITATVDVSHWRVRPLRETLALERLR